MRLCETCGAPCGHRRGSLYCSEGCRPGCEIEGCKNKTSGRKTMCGGHLIQVRKQGHAQPRKKCPTCGEVINRGPGQHAYCSDECRPPCVFQGCTKVCTGGQELCEAHYMQTLRGNELKPLAYANEWVCVVCGAEVQKGHGRRRHCSSRCQVLAGKDRPKSFTCVVCSAEVSLIVPSTKTGQFKRADSRMCDRCKQHGRYGMNARQVAARDGTDCKICGDAVDMDATKPDLFRASVDHIVPRAVGGTDDPANLQLAHLWCNQVKNRRPDFSLLKEV